MYIIFCSGGPSEPTGDHNFGKCRHIMQKATDAKHDIYNYE
jgi:hypothetical protein